MSICSRTRLGKRTLRSRLCRVCVNRLAFREGRPEGKKDSALIERNVAVIDNTSAPLAQGFYLIISCSQRPFPWSLSAGPTPISSSEELLAS